MVVAALIALMAAAAPAQDTPAQPQPPTAATVNAAVITVSDVTESVVDEFAGLQLKRLIDRELVQQEAAQLGISLSEQDIADHLAQTKAHGSLVLLAGRAGLSPATYEQHIADEALLEAVYADFREKHLLRAAKAQYETGDCPMSAGPRVHVFEIVCTDVKQAYLAVERVKGGEPFLIVASELSIRNSESGGDVGWIHPDEYHLADELAGMGVGEIAGPFLQGGEYVIIYKAEFLADRPADFDDVKRQMMAAISAKPAMQFDAGDYLELLARRAQIQVKYAPLAYLNDYYAQLNRIRVLIDGRELPLATPPVRVQTGQMLIPVKPVLQHIDTTLEWDAEQMSLTVQRNESAVRVTAGSQTAVVGINDPVEVDMGLEAELREGMLFAPPRPIVEAIGATVEWDAVRNALLIFSPDGLGELDEDLEAEG